LARTFTLAIKIKKMTQLTHKLIGLFLTVYASLTLTACGPGTGGTGTGPTPTPTLNAQVLASTPISSNAAIGTWTTLDVKTSVLIAADKIIVVSNCLTFNFAGTWVIDENQKIIRQDGGNALTIAFANQQLNFEIKNNKNELISSGAGLTKVSGDVLNPSSQCSN
jgi:hypothetical protein